MTHDPLAKVLAALPDRRKSGRGWVARCPAHDDRNPSLSVDPGDDGRALVKCRAGCTTEAVVGALGLRLADLFPSDDLPRLDARKASTAVQGGAEDFASMEDAMAAYRQRMGSEARAWTYTNAEGEPRMVAMRWERGGGKTYRPLARIGQRWRLTLPDTGRPLFGLDALGGGGRVFVAEGEKATEALASLGVVATTSIGGALAAAKSEWSPLAGREVVVCPDADKPGGEYADRVRSILEALDPPAKVAVLRLPGLEDASGEDAVDWIARVHGGDRGAAAAALEALATEALAAVDDDPMPEGGVSIRDLATDPSALEPPATIRSGLERFDSAQPWGGVAEGTIVLVGGEVGAGKSRFLLNLARGYAKQGVRVAYLLGEMTPTQCWRRILAAESGFRMDELAVPVNAGVVEGVRARLAKLDRALVLAPVHTKESLRRWARWAEVLFLDPLHTLAADSPKPHESEQLVELMRELVQLTADGLVVFAGSEVTQGDGKERGMHNAFKGSSALKQYASTAYFLDDPDDQLQVARCLKQREGARVDLDLRISRSWQGIEVAGSRPSPKSKPKPKRRRKCDEDGVPF